MHVLVRYSCVFRNAYKILQKKDRQDGFSLKSPIFSDLALMRKLVWLSRQPHCSDISISQNNYPSLKGPLFFLFSHMVELFKNPDLFLTCLIPLFRRSTNIQKKHLVRFAKSESQ